MTLLEVVSSHVRPGVPDGGVDFRKMRNLALERLNLSDDQLLSHGWTKFRIKNVIRGEIVSL
jgi:hypothetical protein